MPEQEINLSWSDLPPKRLASLVAEGRNGCFNAAGIRVSAYHPRVVTLQNYTARGALGRGDIVIPRKRKVLLALAEFFHGLADED